MKEKDFDGYIDTIQIGTKRYALKCKVIEIHPIICPKCGGSFELKFGYGKCPFCNTNFTTKFELIEA